MRKNRRKLEIFIFILIFSLSILLRVWKISEIPLPWVDEIVHGSVLYSSAPFIFFLGPNLLSLRLPFIILGVLSIVLTYYFFKDFYDKRVALLASFLLATFPSHIYFSRVALPYIGGLSFGMLSLIFIHKFLKTKNRVYLFLFSVVCGIDLIVRMTLIFFLATTTILSIKFFNLNFKLKWHDLLISLILFLFSTYPFISIVSKAGKIIIFFLLKNFPKTIEGTDLSDIGRNLINGLFNTLPQFMKGQMVYYLQDFSSFLFLALFIISLIILLIKFIFKPKLGYKQFKEDIFSLSVIFLTSILLSTLTITSFRPGDYLLLSPFFMTIIARGLIEASEYVKKYVRGIFHIFIVVLILFTFYEAINFLIYFCSFPSIEKITPGSYLFDYVCITSTKSLIESISTLNYSRIFVDESNVLPFTLKWYSHGKISEEKINFMLVYTEDEETAIEKMIKKLVEGLEDENTIYILTSENCLRFGVYHSFYRKISPKNIFLNTIKNFNKSVILEKEILSPSGYVMYEIYRVTHE
ncbi:MAG: glycosyltransferase family 39 protein [Candidatus Aenigmatarchaeota archaeon]